MIVRTLCVIGSLAFLHCSGAGVTTPNTRDPTASTRDPTTGPRASSTEVTQDSLPIQWINDLPFIGCKIGGGLRVPAFLDTGAQGPTIVDLSEAQSRKLALTVGPLSRSASRDPRFTEVKQANAAIECLWSHGPSPLIAVELRNRPEFVQSAIAAIVGVDYLQQQPVLIDLAHDLVDVAPLLLMKAIDDTNGWIAIRTFGATRTTLVDIEIEGETVTLVVDTGSTHTAFTKEAFDKIGAEPPFTIRLPGETFEHSPILLPPIAAPVTIHGVIGQDILRSRALVLDLGNDRLAVIKGALVKSLDR